MVQLSGKNKAEHSALTRPPVVRLVDILSFPEGPVGGFLGCEAVRRVSLCTVIFLSWRC